MVRYACFLSEYAHYKALHFVIIYIQSIENNKISVKMTNDKNVVKKMIG